MNGKMTLKMIALALLVQGLVVSCAQDDSAAGQDADDESGGGKADNARSDKSSDGDIDEVVDGENVSYRDAQINLVFGDDKNPEVMVYGPFTAVSGKSRASKGLLGMALIVKAGQKIAIEISDGGPEHARPGILSQVVVQASIDGVAQDELRLEAKGDERVPESKYRSAQGAIEVPETAVDKVEFTFELRYENGEAVTVKEGDRPFIADVISDSPSISVVFAGSLSAPSSEGSAVVGEPMRILYDMQRIDTLRKAEAKRQGKEDLICTGHPYTGSQRYTPGIEASFSFRDSANREIVTLRATTSSENRGPAFDVKVPAQAVKASLWFSSVCYNQGISGEQWRIWDSNYSKNFVIPIEQR